METAIIPDFDPSRVNIVSLIRASQPLFLPCPSYPVSLGTGFAPSLVNDKNAGPWKLSPFRQDPRHHASVDLHVSQCSFKSAIEETSKASTDHLSGSLGISIGNAFLSGSVSGSYDNLVVEKGIGVHASRVATHRVGRLNFPTNIEFTEDAALLLRKGETDFANVHGQYFVSGYVLGADRGMMMHFNSRSRLERETTSVTVAVKVLWFEVSHTETTTEEHIQSDVDIEFCAYDTSARDISKRSSKSQDQVSDIQYLARFYGDKIVHTGSDIETTAKKMALKDEVSLSVMACNDIYTSGLVVELILLPYNTLQQYVTAIHS